MGMSESDIAAVTLWDGVDGTAKRDMRDVSSYDCDARRFRLSFFYHYSNATLRMDHGPSILNKILTGRLQTKTTRGDGEK